jgi:predicted PurR-regulated permease PerM
MATRSELESRPQEPHGVAPSTVPVPVAIAPRTILTFIAAITGSALLLAFIYAAHTVLVQLVVAVVLALAAEPLVKAFESRGRSRTTAVGLSFAIVSIALIGLAYLLLAPVIDQTRSLIHDSPMLIDKLSHGEGRLGFLERRFDVVERVQAAVDSGRLNASTGTVLGAVQSAVKTGGSIVFILFLSLFVQLGGRQWFQALVNVFPERDRPRVRRTGDGIAAAVGGYVTGNLMISVIAGSVTTLVLYATGVPYAIALGVIVGIFDLIPMVGATIGTVIAGSVALGTEGVVPAVIVVVAMILYQQVENHLLQQVVYHRTVNLSPLAIALSVAIGAEVGGVVGALLGIPIAASIHVVTRELIAWRRDDQLPATEPGR